jgi:hypothetical protein
MYQFQAIQGLNRLDFSGHNEVKISFAYYNQPICHHGVTVFNVVLTIDPFHSRKCSWKNKIESKQNKTKLSLTKKTDRGTIE